MNPRSLRFTLTVWHSVVLAAVFIVMGALLFIQLQRYVETTLLDAQTRRARQIGETLVSKAEDLGRSSLATMIEGIYEPEKSDRFIRITRKDGTLVYRSGAPLDQSFNPEAVPAAAPWPEVSGTRRVELTSGDPLLVSSFRAGPHGTGDYLVEVGTSSGPVATMLRRLAALLALGLPVIVLVAAVGGYVLVTKALQPVAQMATKAEMITQHNLSERLPSPQTGDELERLSRSLNHMITRLDDAFLNSRRFVADASHELRTPMSVIRGELESIAQSPGLSPESTERLNSLLEEVERLSKLVERLFTLSRLDAGEAQSEWIRFDLGSLVATASSQMSQLADDKSLKLVCENPEAVFVNGDRFRLKQVVVNLLDNAIKYTPDGGSILLRVSQEADEAILEVSDTGIGIPEDALPHVFDRFFRVDRMRSRFPEGAGLGLAIVKAICSAHAGEISVTSTLGKGTSFKVRLPLAREG